VPGVPDKGKPGIALPKGNEVVLCCLLAVQSANAQELRLLNICVITACSKALIVPLNPLLTYLLVTPKISTLNYTRNRFPMMDSKAWRMFERVVTADIQSVVLESLTIITTTTITITITIIITTTPTVIVQAAADVNPLPDQFPLRGLFALELVAPIHVKAPTQECFCGIEGRMENFDLDPVA